MTASIGAPSPYADRNFMGQVHAQSAADAPIATQRYVADNPGARLFIRLDNRSIGFIYTNVDRNTGMVLAVLPNETIGAANIDPAYKTRLLLHEKLWELVNAHLKECPPLIKIEPTCVLSCR